jgi:hypothetical protein
LKLCWVPHPARSLIAERVRSQPLNPRRDATHPSAAEGSSAMRPFYSPNAHTNPHCNSGFPSLYQQSSRGTSSESKT